MALKAVGAPSTYSSQHPELCQVPNSVSPVISDLGTTTAAAQIEGLPFQLLWVQICPTAPASPHHLGLFWGRLCQRASMLEEAASRRGAVSATGS